MQDSLAIAVVKVAKLLPGEGQQSLGHRIGYSLELSFGLPLLDFIGKTGLDQPTRSQPGTDSGCWPIDRSLSATSGGMCCSLALPSTWRCETGRTPPVRRRCHGSRIRFPGGLPVIDLPPLAGTARAGRGKLH